jgi:hypothetical protein
MRLITLTHIVKDSLERYVYRILRLSRFGILLTEKSIVSRYKRVYKEEFGEIF